jgi:hypothetical protein
MVDASKGAPRVIISDASGGEYTCFELFTANAEWHARVAWALFREEDSTLKHGWSLKDVEPDAGFNVESLTPVDVDEHGDMHDVVDAVVELLERSTATPSCHISIDADIVDEDLAAELTPWYRARAGSSETLLDIFRQVQISGTPPRLRPSFAWALSGSMPGLGAIVAHADRPEGENEMSSDDLQRLIASGQPGAPIAVADEDVENPYEFATEKYLEDFLVQNWAATALGRTHDLYTVDGEVVGQQYATSLGPIDILALSKDGQEFLVVELKRGTASDRVVGQVLRYMGAIEAEVAAPGQTVRGVIIGADRDARIDAALRFARGVSFFRYRIHFELEGDA